MAKFRFNTRELSESIKRELNNSSAKTMRAMNAVGGFLNGEAKDRSPQDEGFLTAEISNQTITYKKSHAAVIYIPSNGQSSKYAIKMHEGKYNIGTKSRGKMSKTGKVIGRKFITRAIDDNRKNISLIIKSELEIK